jgi:putative hydrolase of HD superfamily
MILIHDLPEAITGDYHSYKVHSGELSREEKKQREKEAINKYLNILPDTQSKALSVLWEEYEQQDSTEAKFAKTIDRLETMIQWASMDFEFYHDGHDYMGTYGNKEISDFPELLPLWNEMKTRLKERFAAKGAEWKLEYELNTQERR